MLSLKPPTGKTKIITDTESGAKFTIGPLSPKAYLELKRKSKMRTGDDTDPIQWGRNACDRVILAWDGVGETPDSPAECTSENKQLFGERFAFTKVTWLVDQAMELDQEIQAEKGEAKNS